MMLTRKMAADQQSPPPQPPPPQPPQPPQLPQPHPKNQKPKKPGAQKPAPKKTAASTSGVEKPPTNSKAGGAGKKSTKAPAGKKETRKVAEKKEAKKVAEKIPAKKTPRQLAMERNKENNKEGEGDDSSDDGESGSDDSPDAIPSGPPGGKDAEGVDPDKDKGAPAPAPGGQPGTEAGDQEPDAAIFRQQLDPSAQPAPPPVVTHEDWPVLDEVRLEPPGYEGARRKLGYYLDIDQDYLTPAAFSTAKDEFQYNDMQWTREANIGTGSFGSADLYVQADPAGNIVRRIVVKTTSVPHSMWIQARQWHVDERDPTKREHMEIKVMEAIADVPGNHKCVRLQHYTTDRSTFSYRLYLSYLPHGDLSQFTKAKSFYKNINKIPEPALWKWFQDLTEAGLLLSTGAAPRSDAALGWKKIVHCDFKPANVFLDTPEKEHWRSYPPCHLGDFGLAAFTDESDPLNPTLYNAPEAGTDGWFPPEQIQFVEPTSKRLTDTGKLGDASNVWAIGAIIMRLMNTEKYVKQPNYQEDVKGEMEPQLNRDARKFYSKYLCDLVDQCVRFRTYHRIELPALWDRIKRYTGDTYPEYNPDDDGDDEDRFNKLRAAISEQKNGSGKNEHRLEYPDEKYKIGMAVSKDKGQGNGGQGDNDQHGGQDPYEEELGGMNELQDFLKDDLDGADLGEVIGGVYPGHGANRHVDEEYDSEEENDDVVEDGGEDLYD